MPRKFFAVSIALFVAATGAGAQQPGTAGEKRPKLQVLKELPESQLFLEMNLVATSLGVRCDHCHVQATPDFNKTPSNVGGWVWDRDDKPAKAKAREMMRLVVDLNARFKGEARVTCYTCHRGSLLPVHKPPLPPPAGAAVTPAPPVLPSADRVWASYVSAVGQVDSATRNTATVISGWDDRPEGRYAKVEIIVAGADRYRASVSTPDSTTIQALDGDTAWVAVKDRVQRLSSSDLGRVRRIAMRYRPLRERPVDLKVVGIERLADGDAYVATAKIDPITTQTLYFDIATGLLRREMITTETMLLPLMDQVDYEDYRDVDGVKMPFRIRTSDGAPYDTLTRTFLQIRRNVPVDDAQFKPPAAAEKR